MTDISDGFHFSLTLLLRISPVQSIP